MRRTFGDLSLEGMSRGGDRTWFRVHPPGLALDVGRGALALSGTADLFVSHGHLDHALGVPFVLSQRARHGSGTTRVYCPRAIERRLRRWIDETAALEETDYDYSLVGLEGGDRVELVDGLSLEAFDTDHVVPSLGVHLVRRRRRLAPELRGRTPEELAALRARGVEVGEAFSEDAVSYCGDTRAAVLDAHPRLYRSRILILECTFLDPGHRDRAVAYGHVHFEDIVERQERFENEALLLCHLSRRHSVEELRAAVEARLGSLASRVEIAVA